eukprot:gene17395-34583_t
MGTPLYPQNNNQDEDAKLKCKYLKWADEEENPPCNYCRESAKRQAKTGDNAGREFYCCMPRVRVEPMGRANNCGFFDWADGGGGGSGGGFTNGGKAGDDADEGDRSTTAPALLQCKDGPNQGT